jgi:hypothetical protein
LSQRNRAPLIKIRQPVGSVLFQVIGDNLFIAEFTEEGHKIRIMEGNPWIFDGSLISLADFDELTLPAAMTFDHVSFWVRMYNLPLACMGKEVGRKIGAFIGVVEDVDVQDNELGWGEYIRVKIPVESTKPLARG